MFVHVCLYVFKFSNDIIGLVEITSIIKFVKYCIQLYEVVVI